MFIVLEGIDSCGKGTQAALLMKHFTERSDAAPRFLKFPTYDTEQEGFCGPVITNHLMGEWYVSSKNKRNPGVTFPAPDNETDAFVFQCLMAMNKYEMAPTIERAINDGRDIICDRYWPSAYAYGGADGLDLTWLRRIHSCLPAPDLAFLLDIDHEHSAVRRPERRDRYEKKGKAFFDRVAGLYRKLWVETGPLDDFWGFMTKWVVIDGRQSPDAVTREIIAKVDCWQRGRPRD